MRQEYRQIYSHFLADLRALQHCCGKKNAFGPTTAMVVPSAFLLEHSLLILRGDRPRDIASRLESYSDWLDRIADLSIISSTASYRAQAVTRHQNALKAARENSLGKRFEQFKGTAVYECVGVHDYIPAHDEPEICWEPDVLKFEEDGNRMPKASLLEIRAQEIRQSICNRPVPEHNGPSESRFQNIVLEESSNYPGPSAARQGLRSRPDFDSKFG